MARPNVDTERFREMRRRRGPLADFFYRLVREKPMGLLGAVIIVLFVLVSVFADVLAPDPEQRQDVTRRRQGSSAEHLLGTDHTGRDILTIVVYGFTHPLDRLMLMPA